MGDVNTLQGFMVLKSEYCDYSLSLTGKVLDFGSLSNLKMVLTKEGFENFNLKYLGGFWVLIEFCSKQALEKFKIPRRRKKGDESDEDTFDENLEKITGVWIPNAKKCLIISVYAPQEVSEKKMLWSYLNHVIDNWSGETIIMGDFNEVRLNLDQIDDLERNVTKEEIKRAVWDCGTDKSPGPDGFTFGFYRRYWDIMEKDVVDAVSFFFTEVLDRVNGRGWIHNGLYSSKGSNLCEWKSYKIDFHFRRGSLNQISLRRSAKEMIGNGAYFRIEMAIACEGFPTKTRWVKVVLIQNKCHERGKIQLTSRWKAGAGSSQNNNLAVDGSLCLYEASRVRERITQFVIQETLPFDHFDNKRMTSLIQEMLQPRYCHLSLIITCAAALNPTLNRTDNLKEKVKSLTLNAKVTREQTSDDSDNQDGSDEDVYEEEAEAHQLNG
ncbi:RNA-directed DNA polymerase, eukaryota, reverse transcriptase zinc-binding domain protein [Tanacetum coccineum]